MPERILIAVLACVAGLAPCCAQQLLSVPAVLPDAPSPQAADRPAKDTTRGSISGTIVDPNGNLLVSAHVTLVRPTPGPAQEVVSDGDGQFVFLGVAPGPFQLEVAAEGFATQGFAGTLSAGEVLIIPQIALSIATANTEVRIELTSYDLAEEQIKVEELQRVLGFIPNYFVTYQRDTLPLAPRQKFELAFKTSLDPVTFAASGVIAGILQATNSYRGYGQGTAGYAKRYGAAYSDAFVGIMLGSAVFPSLLKQDPRYFYKGTGSVRSRTFYALANAILCKGDNGRWQVNYSGLLGSLASGGISNLYYPASSRKGVALTFQNTSFGIAGSAVGNIFQEFLVRRLTPHAQSKP